MAESMAVWRLLLLFVAACVFTLFARRLRSVLAWWHGLVALEALPHPKRPPGLSGLLGGPGYSVFKSGQYYKQFNSWAVSLGGMFSMRILWFKAVIITDPALAHQVLSREAGLDKPNDSYKSPMDLLTSASHRTSLVTHDTASALWRLVRKGVAPAFATNNMKKEFPRFAEIGQQLVDELRACGPGAVVDMDLAAQRESLDVLGSVGFGVQFGATRSLLGGDAPGSALRALQDGMAEVQRHMGAPWRRWHVMRIFPSVQRGRVAMRQYQVVIEELLRAVRTRGPPAKDDTTIAAHLLRIVDPATGRGLPDELLLPEVAILYLAGVETSAHTVAFVLYLVSQHADVEAKIAAELDGQGLLASAQRPRPRTMACEDLARLPYLSWVIKEAMRLYPVVPMGTVRQAPASGMQLGGHAIPPDAMLWVFFSAMFRSPHVWDAPDEFRPERWADTDAEFASPAGSTPGVATRMDPPDPLAQQGPDDGPSPNPKSWSADGDAPTSKRPKRFIPFSFGARDCVGRSLATINYKMLLAVLLGNFRFPLAEEAGGAEGVEASICMRATLQFSRGLPMHCLPRAA